MRLLTLVLHALSLLFVVQSRGTSSLKLPRQSSEPLQDIVTWDQYSLKIYGKRVFLFAGEVHPYRMPVQSLHLDVFQKVKSLGFNAVSFYVFWGLHEPKKGKISFEGILDLQPFMDAAKEAGVYLIARPGPYINAEVSGGGFPGWGVSDPAVWRTSNASYVDAYQLYMLTVGEIIAKNEITKGGPVILYQSENEYSHFQEPYSEDFAYEEDLIKVIRESGITVPITTNDAYAGGTYTSVDIYGFDSYPNGFDCSNPTHWDSNAVPTDFWQSHMSINPDTLFAMYEYQAGAFDGWGGAGYDKCAQLLGPEFERVFYKNQYATSTTIFALYMLYGGTNWGGIAHPGVYTSYDYGSAIAEDRTLREKYYELKLQANFLAVSPAYYTSRPLNAEAPKGAFSDNSDVNIIQTKDVVGNSTTFYTVRQSDPSSLNTQSYKLSVPSTAGDLTIPALGGTLTLTGRDSKIHVVDYAVGNSEILYSTAEIFTWATIDDRDVIVVYGNEGEVHETAFKFDSSSSSLAEAKVLSGSGEVSSQTLESGALALQYTTSGQTVVEIGSGILLYILDRPTAYQFWVVHPPSHRDGFYSTEDPIIVKGGYLIRSASFSRGGVKIRGDLNATTDFEFIVPKAHSKWVTFNGERLRVKPTEYGTITAIKEANLPLVDLPDLSSLDWKTADSLPEISSEYDDSKWTKADLTSTNNPRDLTTVANLYASDYGYHTGNILWRGHFIAEGTESGFNVEMAGGQAFGYSVWLDADFLGSWYGNAVDSSWPLSLTIESTLPPGSSHVITILQDHMGLDEDWVAASETFKAPRGILNFGFQGSSAPVIWKLTGNLGGEDYVDQTRGPLNEGGLYGERQGWHLPGFDDSAWEDSSPLDGVEQAGVSFYRTSFDLDIPAGVDYPIAMVTTNATANPYFRSKLYVNGYQFGRYVNSIGPQTVFPVPEGILNYHGTNALAVALWATEPTGGKLDSLTLNFTAQVDSSMGKVKNQEFTPWSKRSNAY